MNNLQNIDKSSQPRAGLRIVAISDTHGFHDRLIMPKADVLIHAGDACMAGSRSEFLNFINWMGRQPFKHKIYVPGNHDFYVERDQSIAQILCVERGVMLVIDRTVRVDGVRFYGSPWVPNLSGWAFYAPPLTLINRFRRIPDDVDVLITHSPARGILDVGRHHYGSIELTDRLKDLIQLKAHIFGHIHSSYGIMKIGKYLAVNAAILNDDYQIQNSPAIIDI